MRTFFVLTGLLTVTVGCAAMSLTGNINDGRYVSPNGKVSISKAAIALPGSVGLRDFYDADSDRGFLEDSNEFGLHGIYYAPLAQLGASMPANAAQRRDALGAVLSNFAIPNVFGEIQPPAVLEHQEFVPDGDAESLLVVARLPGLSGAYDMRTNQHFDAYVVALILVRNGYAFVVRTQSNITDTEEIAAAARASGALAELREIEARVVVQP